MTSTAEPQSERQEIAIAVVEREGQFLIGLRPANSALGGLWEFPGGKVERGETPETAAQRECDEEAGLLVRVTREYPMVDHDYQHGSVRLRFFACEAIKQLRALPTRFRWVSRQELARYHFPPANGELIEQLIAAAE